MGTKPSNSGCWSSLSSPFATEIHVLDHRHPRIVQNLHQRRVDMYAATPRHHDSQTCPEYPKIIETMLTQGSTPPSPSPKRAPEHLLRRLRHHHHRPPRHPLRLPLARHPTIVTQIHAELAAALPAKPLVEAHFVRMPYLRATILEMLRLRSPVMHRTRRACTDTALPLRGGPSS